MAGKSAKKKVPAQKAREIQTQNKIERRAALSTGLLFVGIFVLFLFLSLSSSVPEPQQKGIQVMLGKTNTGTSKQLEEVEESTDKKDDAEELKTPDAEKAEETKTAKSSEREAAASAEQTSVTQEDEPAPEMKEESAEVEKPEEKESEAKKNTDEGEGEADKSTKKEERNPDEKALFTPGDDSKGNQDEEGQQGEESGDKEVDQPTKKGEADVDEQGISFSLDGRSITKYPNVKDQSQKYGKVVVEITVNQEGKVIDAEPGKQGSTVTDQQLKRIAKKAALETEFNANPDGPNRQIGQMTINFKLQ